MTTIKQPTVIDKDSISSSVMSLSYLCSNSDQGEYNSIQIYPTTNKLEIAGDISAYTPTTKPDKIDSSHAKIDLHHTYTSQAIIDEFIGSLGGETVAYSSILINENPDQSTKNSEGFIVTIGSINTEKVTIDSDWVNNWYYLFERLPQRIMYTETGKSLSIAVDVNQGKVNIEPTQEQYYNDTWLYIYGKNHKEIDENTEKEFYVYENTGTASGLWAGEATIAQSNTVTLTVQSNPEIDYYYSGVRRTDVENFPYNTTHLFAYEVTYTDPKTNVATTYDEKICMYVPNAAYVLGTYNGDHWFFTPNSNGTVNRIAGGEQETIDNMNREYKNIKFYLKDWGE